MEISEATTVKFVSSTLKTISEFFSLSKGMGLVTYLISA